MKHLLYLLLFGCSFTVTAQEPDSSDWTNNSLDWYPQHFIGLEAGMDLSHGSSAVHVGFSSAYLERSCVLGRVARGESVGISLNPSLNSYGVYFNRWITVAMFSFGLKGAYESNGSHQWATIQPQIGLGYGMFRLTYNYSIPFFFGARETVSRSSLGIAYTFSIADWVN